MGDASDIAGAFRKTDSAGLAVAIILHAALAALLVMQINWRDDPPPPVREGISVSLASEVSLESTAPDPVAEARAATAPVVGDELPEPDPVSEPETRRPDDTPRPTPRSSNKPRADRTPTPRNTSPPPSTPRKNPPSNPGSTDFDNAFGPGSGSNPDSNDLRVPASQIGPAETTSLRRELNRQIRPKWQGLTPQGADAELLVSVLSFRLAENGTLQGTPSCRTKPSSITPSNRPQAALHCERAIRAVQLAAPFKLPDRLYNGWKSITNWEMKKQ